LNIASVVFLMNFYQTRQRKSQPKTHMYCN